MIDLRAGLVVSRPLSLGVAVRLGGRSLVKVSRELQRRVPLPPAREGRAKTCAYEDVRLFLIVFASSLSAFIVVVVVVVSLSLSLSRVYCAQNGRT